MKKRSEKGTHNDDDDDEKEIVSDVAEGERNHVLSLPDEVLSQILSYLDVNSLCNCSLVNFRFYFLIENLFLWKQLYLQTYYLSSLPWPSSFSPTLSISPPSPSSSTSMPSFYSFSINLASVHQCNTIIPSLSGSRYQLHKRTSWRKLYSIRRRLENFYVISSTPLSELFSTTNSSPTPLPLSSWKGNHFSLCGSILYQEACSLLLQDLSSITLSQSESIFISQRDSNKKKSLKDKFIEKEEKLRRLELLREREIEELLTSSYEEYMSSLSFSPKNAFVWSKMATILSSFPLLLNLSRQECEYFYGQSIMKFGISVELDTSPLSSSTWDSWGLTLVDRYKRLSNISCSCSCPCPCPCPCPCGPQISIHSPSSTTITTITTTTTTTLHNSSFCSVGKSTSCIFILLEEILVDSVSKFSEGIRLQPTDHLILVHSAYSLELLSFHSLSHAYCECQCKNNIENLRKSAYRYLSHSLDQYKKLEELNKEDIHGLKRYALCLHERAALSFTLGLSPSLCISDLSLCCSKIQRAISLYSTSSSSSFSSISSTHPLHGIPSSSYTLFQMWGKALSSMGIIQASIEGSTNELKTYHSYFNESLTKFNIASQLRPKSKSVLLDWSMALMSYYSLQKREKDKEIHSYKLESDKNLELLLEMSGQKLFFCEDIVEINKKRPGCQVCRSGYSSSDGIQSNSRSNSVKGYNQNEVLFIFVRLYSLLKDETKFKYYLNLLKTNNKKRFQEIFKFITKNSNLFLYNSDENDEGEIINNQQNSTSFQQQQQQQQQQQHVHLPPTEVYYMNCTFSEITFLNLFPKDFQSFCDCTWFQDMLFD